MSVTRLNQYVPTLDSKIQQPPNAWESPNLNFEFLSSESAGISSISPQEELKIPVLFYSVPETQGQMNDLAVFFRIKIPDYGHDEYFKEVVVPLSKLQVVQLPREINLEILLSLPIADLLKIRQICKYYKTIIDTTPEIQVKIAHHYLQTMQPKCNIPIDDLKADLTNNKLSVEVSNNLCLWKLIQNSSSTLPQLNGTIPWIRHLIIKNGRPNELTELFKQLHGQSNRLLTLHLLNCEMDSKTVDALRSLQTSDRHRPPVLYLSNLKSIDCTLPEELSAPSPQVFIIDPNKANEYSIERFLTKESDLNELNELEQQVLDESFSGKQILRKLNELHPIIQAGIVSSIWHSKLAPATENTSAFSKGSIRRQVDSFISKEPHHAAIRVAVKKRAFLGEEFS